MLKLMRISTNVVCQKFVISLVLSLPFTSLLSPLNPVFSQVDPF